MKTVTSISDALRPFQRDGAAFAFHHRRTLICDQPGLGKTIQALAAIEATSSYPAIVVCPANLKINWQREIAKWLPHRSSLIHYGLKQTNSDYADFHIVNYEIIHKRKFNPKAVVFDELNYCKSPTAKRTRACVRLTNCVEVDGLIIGLTGTPVLSRTHELISQLEVIRRLDDFGGAIQFEKAYCQWYTMTVKTPYGTKDIRRYYGGKNLDELRRRLTSSIMIRRKKSEVLAELPEKQRVTLWIPGDEIVMRDYHSCNHPPETDSEALVLISTLRQLSAKAKIPAVIEWVNNFDEPLVIFVHHRTIGAALAEQIPCVSIRGGMTPKEKQASIDAFQNGDVNRIICSIQAASVGLNLTAASDVLFVETPWTPGEAEQCEDRCHRIGQSNSVTAWYSAIPDTIDEDIFDLLRKKQQTVTGATDGFDINAALAARMMRKAAA